MLASFRNMIEACGSRADVMRLTLLFTFFAAIAQGLAYALLFPFFAALAEGSDEVWRYVGAIIVLVILDALFRYGESKGSWRVYIEVSDETRSNLGEQLKRMPLEQLARRQTGDLNSVLTGNVNDVVSIAGGLFSMVVNTMVTPLVTVAATFFIDWRLAVSMLVIFPMAIPVYRIIRAAGARENRLSATAHADAASHIIEYTQGLSVLRATRQVGPESQRLQASLARLREAQAKGTRLVTLPSILMSALVQVGILLITALAVHFALGASISVAAVLALIVVAIRFSEPLALFANMSAMFDFMEAAIERITELLAVPPLPQIGESEDPQNAHVVFDDVWFTYDQGDEAVLRGISFEFPENSLTALVGSSGSGKTTITKLLTRFADPQQGTITIGGADVRSLTQAQLMQQFSVVFQDVYLFDDSIRENIRLAKADATDDEIIAAAKAANCHQFISALPHGYDTGVGEIGGALSGGERQRISIAPAILKDAPIVILDEPTSALDTESEVAVQRAIDTLVQNKTVLVIAHRLSTIVAANNIVVLEAGQIVEEGDHSALLELDGRYAEMWNAQLADRHWQITGGEVAEARLPLESA
ncbi:MAG: ABC transporter ATP-binding protein [Acidobacteriota bacterium]